MRVRLWQRADGFLLINTPARPRREGESWDAYYAEVFDRAEANQPELQGLPHFDLEQSALPRTREHRDYWRLRNGRVVVELPDSDERG